MGYLTANNGSFPQRLNISRTKGNSCHAKFSFVCKEERCGYMDGNEISMVF